MVAATAGAGAQAVRVRRLFAHAGEPLLAEAGLEKEVAEARHAPAGPPPAGLGASFLRSVARVAAADAVAGALNDALKGKVKEVAAFKEALLKLLGSSVPSGGTVTLGCAGGALTMGFDGTTSTLKDPELCPALLDVYLGASPISGAAKDGVATGFAATFADGACTVKKAAPAEAAA